MAHFFKKKNKASQNIRNNRERPNRSEVHLKKWETVVDSGEESSR